MSRFEHQNLVLVIDAIPASTSTDLLDFDRRELLPLDPVVFLRVAEDDAPDRQRYAHANGVRGDNHFAFPACELPSFLPPRLRRQRTVDAEDCSRPVRASERMIRKQLRHVNYGNIIAAMEDTELNGRGDMLRSISQFLLLDGNKAAPAAMLIVLVEYLQGQQAQRIKIAAAIRLHRRLDRVVGLAGVGHADEEHESVSEVCRVDHHVLQIELGYVFD